MTLVRSKICKYIYVSELQIHENLLEEEKKERG